MKTFNTAFLAALALTLVISHVTCDCPSPRRSTVLTYNAGLTTTVYGYEDRRSAVIDAIVAQGNDTDFMCLQELWYESDMLEVIANLQSDFPYHYSAIHSDVGMLRYSRRKRFFSSFLDWMFPGRHTVPCGVAELTPFLACYTVYCSSSSDGRACTLANCENSYYGLSQSCRSCISVSSSGVADILSKCANKGKVYNRMNGPGLLVLSKQPLDVAIYVDYQDGREVLLERGFIGVQVAGISEPYVCTHLSAGFATYYEERLKPRYNSYEEQQAGEISILNSTFYGFPHVLMGDFNTGPARNESGLPELQGELPANYDTLINQLGYQNPYMENDGRCTYCSSKNAVLVAAGKTSGGDVAIDHVLTKNVISDVASAKRVVDTKDVQLSDHYGTKLDICLP